MIDWGYIAVELLVLALIIFGITKVPTRWRGLAIFFTTIIITFSLFVAVAASQGPLLCSSPSGAPC
jgi:hypothetical protein